MKLWFLVSSS